LGTESFDKVEEQIHSGIKSLRNTGKKSDGLKSVLMASSRPVAMAVVAADEELDSGYCSVQRLRLSRGLFDWS
jgi:hypothetical protein